MNKLEVAIKLLQIINERKVINSRIIADELNVNIRTAQRYLRDLSALPCIGNKNNNRDYELYPDYKFKEAVLNSSLCEIILNKLNKNYKSSVTNEVFCLVCGYASDEILHSIFIFDDNDKNNKLKLKQLTSKVKAIREAQQCSSK
jgi:predicted DNA-binding transcriptional regulator YafY